MKIVDEISIQELREMAGKMFGNLVKADVDVNRKIIVVDMDMQVDGEQYLLENGSAQDDLWGINLKPDLFGTDEFIEFDSMINIRPRQNNPTRDIIDERIRQSIRELVDEVVHE